MQAYQLLSWKQRNILKGYIMHSHIMYQQLYFTMANERVSSDKMRKDLGMSYGFEPNPVLENSTIHDINYDMYLSLVLILEESEEPNDVLAIQKLVGGVVSETCRVYEYMKEVRVKAISFKLTAETLEYSKLAEEAARQKYVEIIEIYNLLFPEITVTNLPKPSKPNT